MLILGHSRERLPEDFGAEPLLAVRQCLQELGHELGQVQQRRAAAGQDALCTRSGRSEESSAALNALPQTPERCRTTLPSPHISSMHVV